MKVTYREMGKHSRYASGTLDFDATETNECGTHILNYFVAQFYGERGLAYRLDLNGRGGAKKCRTIMEAESEVARLTKTVDRVGCRPIEEIESCIIEIW